jgi:hypothetical protein
VVNYLRNVDFVWDLERSKQLKLMLLTPRDAQGHTGARSPTYFAGATIKKMCFVGKTEWRDLVLRAQL